MPKPLNEVLAVAFSQWLYEEGSKGLPIDVEDLYLDAADALLDLIGFWNGYEDE